MTLDIYIDKPWVGYNDSFTLQENTADISVLKKKMRISQNV